jgi:hypothetical protein
MDGVRGQAPTYTNTRVEPENKNPGFVQGG